MVASHMCAGRRAARLFSLGEKGRALVQKSELAREKPSCDIRLRPLCHV